MIRVAHAEVISYLSKFYESAHLNRILSALIRPPPRTTVRVCDADADAHAVARELAALLPPEFAPRVHATIPHCLVMPLVEDRTLTRLQRRLIVDRGCGAAVMRGANIFAPGVLSAPRRLSVGEAVSGFVDVNGVLRRGVFSEDDNDDDESDNADVADGGASDVNAFQFVGNGTVTMPRRAMFARDASGVAVEMTAPIFRTPALHGVMNERVFLQNEESMLAVLALDPQPGELVLDMCAAPGGKTSHIASLMRGRGSIVAVDRSQSKCERLLATCERFGASNVSVMVGDANKLRLGNVYDVQRVDGGARRRESMRFERQFDRVLLDAPCSAVGQRPRFEITQRLSELEQYASYQRKLLLRACSLLRPGGRLVYSTCTLMPDENEANVKFILNAEPQLRLIAARPKLGDDALAPQQFGLTAEQAQLVQRFDPSSERTDGIAFFIACFEKEQ
jgi:16S rRNA C967 or C1407 C5-methylase (RsmB/RsmF family)